MAKKRLIIIDGNHLVHRAFYAVQARLVTRSGEPTNALFGFASMLLNIIEREKPDFLVVAFDEKAPTFRHEAHAGYKATRAKAPDELYVQIPRVREMLLKARIPMFSREGLEADDFMGALAVRASRQGMESIVVTGDMDALQLVDAAVQVVFPHKGYRDPIVYDRQAVFEKYGVYPDQIVDYKALMGDHSDNIKGVDGIGPKGAVSLLQKYGTLDGIYDHLPEVRGTLRDKLEKGRKDAYFAQKLARIVTDIDLDFDLDAADFRTCDFQALGRFFEDMEMRSLQGRLKKLTPENLPGARQQMSLFDL